MIGVLIQVLVLLAGLALLFRYARRTDDNLWLILTAFAFAAMMLSDLYYMAHTALLEGVRVPFAANDIADFGSFLLLGAALSAAVGLKRGRFPGVTVAAIVFGLANIALWIGWSGEWVRDIFGGLPFAWFICACFQSLYQTPAVTGAERGAFWALCGLICLLQTGTFFTAAPLSAALDTVCYVLLTAGEVWVLLRGVLSLRAGRSPDAAAALGFTGLLWIYICMYMAEGVIYEVYSNLSTLHQLLLLLALRKKVKQP